MISKNAGDVSSTVDFGGASITVSIAKKDLTKIKEYVKSHRYTNKTVLKLDCGFEKPVKLDLRAHNPGAKAAAKDAGSDDVV